MRKKVDLKPNVYEFSAVRYVPGYGDWDHESVRIKAKNKVEAIGKFKKLKWIYKNGYHLQSVED
jgi:hypothetical protein